MKKILSVALSLLMIVGLNINVSASNEVTEAGKSQSKVQKTIGSEFSVLVPKRIHMTSDTEEFTVQAKGNIAPTQILEVTTDEAVVMSRANDAEYSKNATTSLKDCSWTYNTLTSDYTSKNGSVTFEESTAGEYSGTATFYINLNEKAEESVAVSVSATDKDGNDLNATANSIVGNSKEQLLYKLAESGLVESEDNVTALIEVKSDEFDDIANTTFNVSNIANEGDEIAIYHYNETTEEWEYIGTKKVLANGTVSANFTSYSPVAFIVNEYSAPGLYAADGTLTKTWKQLIDDGDLKVTDGVLVGGSKKSGACPNCQYFAGAGTLVIDSSVTAIGNRAFGCNIGDGTSSSDLTKVVVPSSVKSIGIAAFAYCSNLTTVSLVDGLESIGTDAFSYCGKLTSIVIPNTVTKIDSTAFMQCHSLTSVVFSGGIDLAKEGVFVGCSNMKSFVLPNGVKTIGENSFSGCEKLSYVVIPNTVTKIERHAFYRNLSLKTIDIPNSVSSIDADAFLDCSNLETINYSGTATGAPWGATNATVVK